MTEHKLEDTAEASARGVNQSQLEGDIHQDNYRNQRKDTDLRLIEYKLKFRRFTRHEDPTPEERWHKMHHSGQVSARIQRQRYRQINMKK